MMEDNHSVWIVDDKKASCKSQVAALWRCRHLVLQLAIRDVTAFYRQTVLGPMWLIVQPILTTGVYALVFGQVVKVPTDAIPKPLFYFTGVILWNYFSECTHKVSSSLRDNNILFAKIYFPKLVVPVSISIALMFRFAIQFALLIALVLVVGSYNIHLHKYWVILPLVLLVLIIHSVGFGLVLAAFTSKYRDLALLAAFITQLMMYTTTVIYPLSIAPKQLYLFIVANPMTAVIESFRCILLNKGVLNISQLLVAATCAGILLVTGVYLFIRSEQKSVDVI
ncbi:ABC transporter permease [Pedobacter faecalis]|uniref:ABC transporter permease n=1 Tax=Pedobacter faecalis TaxID=3041495 RepID=UPI00254EA4F2|nr:ABC transporter permease [Pedobacter sp. ELA7]